MDQLAGKFIIFMYFSHNLMHVMFKHTAQLHKYTYIYAYSPSLSVLVVKTSTGENFFTLNRNDTTGAPIFDVHKAVFSPKGTYLVTWYLASLSPHVL